MIWGKHLARMAWGALAALSILAAPAAAQFQSDGYKFLDAIKKKDVDAAIAAITEPGSTIINTRDISTGETALHLVVKRRDVTWIRYLLQQGANPNIQDVDGVTPLVLAARMGFIDGVQALVDGKARVDEANSTGETPLISAVHARDVDLMRVLLKAGADPDRADNSGRSARDYASQPNARSSLLAEIEKFDKHDQGSGGAYGPSF